MKLKLLCKKSFILHLILIEYQFLTKYYFILPDTIVLFCLIKLMHKSVFRNQWLIYAYVLCEQNYIYVHKSGKYNSFTFIQTHNCVFQEKRHRLYKIDILESY